MPTLQSGPRSRLPAETLRGLYAVIGIIENVLSRNKKSRVTSADSGRPLTGREFQDLLRKAEKTQGVPGD